MSRTLGRIEALLLDPRTMRALVLFVGAGVVLYLAAIFWFGWQDTAGALSALGPVTMLMGAGLASSSYLWRFWRWEISLRHFGYALPRAPHLAVYLSGLALTATPGKSGETFRSALLLQQGVRVPHSLAAFVVDRATDVLGMCLLGFGSAWLVGQQHAWAWGAAFAAMLLGSRLFAGLLLHPRAGACWDWLLQGRRWWALKSGQVIFESWASLWRLPSVTAFSVLAMLAYGTQALVFAWFCHVARTGLPAPLCVLIFVQATLFGAASMVPGGLGAMEAALVIQMSERGVDDAVAVSLAIAIRLVTLWFGMALGTLGLLWSSRRARCMPELEPPVS
jgi:uncharacterized membrane protein YbhN (UPF0104 family)